ncbi:MAG TPA: pre-peptidase C-terminal domain-containing protein [Verrucomicrobiae bacterium]|nr:pre-peptidase C-terminal domain-containing protein [Verrucomicrobiae bacterium]
MFFTNATPDTVYYVGVKSEDQQSAEYALYGISSDLPFADIDSNGTMHLRGFPVSAVIPDGSPEKPGVVNMVAIGISPLVAGLVTVDNEVIHESFGDLVGTLSHNGQYVVLNNHFADIGVIDHIFHYDDSQSGRSPITRPTDGPGRLTDYVGASASGLWLLTMSDNAPAHIGTNLQFRVNITPAGAVAGGLDGTVFANAWNYYFIDVPADATSLTINLTRMSGPLDVFARLNDIPDTANYDKSASLTPPGGSLTITVNDVPPLNAGRYYIGVFNPNAVPVTYHIDATIERNPKAEIAQLFTSTNTPVAVLDQALTQSGIDVKDPRSVVEARVGVRIDHPRIADLVLHLVSPEGTRVLLAENRGGATTNGYGAGKAYAGFTDNTNLTDQLIKFAKPPFATNTSLTTNLVSGFEGVSARGYNTGEVFDGWTVENVFVTTNATGSGFTRSLPTVINDPGIAQSGNSYLNLGRGDISREIPTQPGVNYTLTFAYRSAGTGPINAQILLDGSLNSFISAAGTNWQSKTIQFVASSSSTTLEILPGLNNPGLLLDTFELAGVAGIIYYFPEEPLEILKGQGALGRWNLEVLDNRAGPSTNGVLLSWQLQLVLSRTNAFVTKVTNGIPVNGTVQGAGITYFSVDVPREATFATNVVISGGDMVLLYSGSGLPTGSLPNDVVVDRFGPGGEILVLDTNTPPVLRPGQRYYLGVANFNPFETNDFTLFVDFDLGDSGLIGPTVLTNGVGFTHTIAVTNAIDYYQFTVSSNAYSATFELFPQNGNVDMIIRRGLPVRDPLPTYNVYDYGSFQSDTNVEQVIVTTNSAPVALGPGVWYIGVFNSDTNAVKYTVRATEALNPYLIIPLKSGVPVNVTQNVTNVVTNFFVFSIPASNADNTVYARFDLFNASAPATLYVNPDNLFDPSEALYRTNTGPAGGARLFVTPSGTNTIAGDWYLNVGGYAVTNIDFTVMATLLTNGFPPITTLSNAVTVTNYALGSLDAPRLDYYRFTVTTNAKYADFELFPISGNVDLLLIKGPGLPDTNRFDYASQNTALTNEFIRVGRGSSPVSLTPGDWFLAVYNREDYAARYAIRVTQALDGAVRSIGPDITYPGFAATRSLDYYQITVPSGATALNIQLSFTNATARQLRMFLRKGKPLPDAANFDYQSGSASAPGDFVGVEAVSVSPSSLPVALTPGDWFLSVTNTGSLALNYDLSYHLTGDIAQPTNNVEVPSQLVISNNQVCVLWKAQIGSSYKVEGKASLTQTNWVADSGVIVANVTNEQYCVSFSDTNRFFRVMLQGGGGSGGSTNATEITVGQQPTITSTSFCLSWSSVVNTVYHVEGKVSLNQANWVTVSPAITATSTTSSYCVPLTDTNRFFRVVK